MSQNNSFHNSILDTITDHIAVLDKSGVIVYVNKSWIEFGLNNGLSTQKEWLGVNYIENCKINIEDDTPLLAEVIQDILENRRSNYYLEYPCHSDTEQRWFLMRVTRFFSENELFIIIEHTNITERKLAEEHVIRLSQIDSLTGLANRRYFDDFFDSEWKRCTRSEMPISLAMIDIDYFKLLNDFSGHRAGDKCLKEISDILKNYTKRPTDICSRYGGDEFMIVYGNTVQDESLVLMLKLMDEIKKLEIPNPNSPINNTISVSIGLVTTYPDVDSNIEELIQASDRLLYKAKEGGRNYIEFLSI
ncbi:MAG: sensor domain-containing diguanylate cyclase [Candidatus Thiodiazotropha sp. L084R]